MKLRALTTVLVAASIAASAAAAGNPPVKGQGHGRGARGGEAPAAGLACKGRQLLLRGLYVSGSAGADGTGSFVVDVKRADRLGKRLKLVGTQVTVAVDASTRIRRQGDASLADLQANDRVAVLARACKPAAADSAPTLLARAVVARPAVPPSVDPGA